ncbi:class I SAM-dependent methyltransferase [Nitrosospira sp. NpAV]|uniref:class I SAM-dependent methyltransferase n=1 Tax=Nitrosospira sp. NpAV TaxID=58133 RepID=UPI0005A24A81|nr:class I SAM-dependent methyltransferase [Nitrosospira sp. NpAV]KIO47896.1 methyltransferase [Nitrosospira sp. NpAV]
MRAKPSAASAFSDPQAVARYAEGPPRMVPGFHDMQRLTSLLLEEHVPEKGRVLVVGAGGGLELKAYVETHPHWTLDGVDPSPEMLGLAERAIGPLKARVQLHQGYIEVSPEGPFDGASCLLTMHFIDRAERLRTLREIHRRLKLGAPLVLVHMSFSQGEWERKVWLSRYAAFAVSSGIDPEKAEAGRAAVDDRLHILNPEQDEELLREAGFSKVSLFYTGFTFRGWVAYA